MLERFLQYSMERGRKIRVLMQDKDALRTKNIAVLAFDEREVCYMTAGRKTPQTAPRTALLSAAYARGDDGALE